MAINFHQETTTVFIFTQRNANIDQQEIIPSRRQTNTTELDNTKTWLAMSVLELTISKENHGRMLSCVAVHESYSTRSSSIEVRLDVMFVPETRLVGIPTTDIEDLKDSIAIRCVVSANPKASVVWRREGQNQPASLQELLQFSPAIRQHSGLYTCHARNKAGDSVPIRVQIDVKYRPKVISVGRERVKTSTLFAPVNFECLGEGNPPPTYQWIQKKTSQQSDSVVERGREAKLQIKNVTYEYQGEWRCKATNVIKGEEQSDISEPIILQVHGAPQVLRHTAAREIFVESGQTVDLSMVVCADPRPRSVAWEWGSLRLEAGNEMGKFKVDDVTQEEGEDCYLTTLHVKDTSATDSRTYYLLVENDKGKDMHAVQLYVNEPLQMSTLVSVAGALLVGILVLVCACIYAIRAEKCCFSNRPKVISVGRERVKTSTLFAPVNFECLGEGNPPPTYQWIQKKTSQQSDSVVERGREAKLHIKNVTYEYQGEWRCKATNVIKGEEQSDISEPIILQVHGAPQVLRHTAAREIFVESGQTVDLSMVVCADPRPRSVAWEWGSLRLEAGNEMGKFKVDDVTQEEGEDCYLTTLHVKDTSATDSRTYYLLVENDKGKDMHAVQLYVNGE
ncbi:unnamed protein product [Ceutorhynchus assimilis]|uniref:Ig-like domain-containing protein n=1 Tax=Ceutorhynchus assimilis TaxID=467358 RepID=A0A9N9QFK8_9CUCU|nr:unnamed protein product [Ceutorhynchus assimilis]